MSAFKWSKVKFDEYGLGVRESKCGRAQIVKLNEPKGSHVSFNEYLPVLDGKILPRYFKLAPAKEAIECVERGDPLPKVGKPSYVQVDARFNDDNPSIHHGKTYTSYDDLKDFFARARASKGQGSANEANPFEALDLDETASLADCKAAYRKLALEFHPDHNPDDKEAEEKFKAVTAAWEQIKALEAA